MVCWPQSTLVRAIYSPAAAALKRRALRRSHAAGVGWGLARTGGMMMATPGMFRGKKTTTVVRIEDLPQGMIQQEENTETTKAKRARREQGDGKAETTTKSGRAKAKSKPVAPESPEQQPPYPPVLLQVRQNMHKFANCILLTRVGGFYELYFEQAQEVGPLLNLKVAARKTSAGSVPMAGFPFFQLERFLKILVHDLHRYVAIADEFPNSAADKVRSGGLMHDRRVARIVTPGTLIDENFMDPYTNNYVMGIHAGGPAAEAEDAVGLAWLDLSTGHFSTQATTLAALGAVLSRVAPREIVLDAGLQDSRGSHPLFAVLDDDRQQQAVVTFGPPLVDGAVDTSLARMADWTPLLESAIPPAAASHFTPSEVAAGSLLLRYVRDRLQGLTMLRLQPPVRQEGLQLMTIDRNSMRSLEIKQTLRDGLLRGSLLHAIRRTVTKSGARLLNEWLSAPSTALAVIEGRQDLVARFVADEELRDSITVLLRRSHDVHRLVQKFALGRGAPDDLLDLAKTIAATEAIVAQLQHATTSSSTPDPALEALTARIFLERPCSLAKCIRDSVDEEGLEQQHAMAASEADALLGLAESVVQAEGTADDERVLQTKRRRRKGHVDPDADMDERKVAQDELATSTARRRRSLRDYYGEDNEAWVMRPSASAALRDLHAQLADLTREREALTEKLRTQLQAPSLVLKWTPGLGHICHVKRGRGKAAHSETVDGADTSATMLSSSRTTRSLHMPEWTALGQRIDQTRFHIRAEEQIVFQTLRASVVRCLVPLRRNAAVLDELDIATAFARLAGEQKLCRPRLHHGTTTAISGGRHPTVEGGLAEQGCSFARNDCYVGGQASDHEAPTAGSLWLITGPNMGGKSTFLRQNALITILAQIGCFVPADHAELGIVDALFSRVGSADNLFRDQSTFMVEMLETAHILRHATPRSFVIMDEIGRGTTPADGTAVAYAALHHLVHVNRCRTLFATHFYELADLAAADGILAADDGSRPAPVELYCTDVEEDGQGGFVYVHRLRRGINRQSHALKVARLAGLPEAAVRVAEGVLQTVEGAA